MRRDACRGGKAEFLLGTAHASFNVVMVVSTRRHWMLVACAVALAVAAAGCNSPTLPLPPPNPPAIQSVMTLNGQVVIKGGQYSVEPLAKVSGFNHANSRMGDTVADSHGAFILGVEAQPGNTVEVWQQVDHVVSDPVMVVVPPPQP